MRMGAPVAALSCMAPPTWSMWAWVITICLSVSPSSRRIARIPSISSPGSMTMASYVCSSPMMEQLHCSGPTGMTLCIIRMSVRHRQSVLIAINPKITEYADVALQQFLGFLVKGIGSVALHIQRSDHAVILGMQNRNDDL